MLGIIVAVAWLLFSSVIDRVAVLAEPGAYSVGDRICLCLLFTVIVFAPMSAIAVGMVMNA
jgi:hypothetical protein